MFVIIFDSPDKTYIKIPPLLLPISRELLVSPVSNLQQMSLNHFKDHLSPFIRKQHLELSTERQVMKTDYPVFIYCNFKQYINNLICSIKPYDEVAAIRRVPLLKNAILIVDSKNYQQRIIKQGQVQIVDKLLPKEGSVYILGKQLQLLPKQGGDNETRTNKKWSQLIMDKWNKFQSPNFCVYVMI